MVSTAHVRGNTADQYRQHKSPVQVPLHPLLANIYPMCVSLSKGCRLNVESSLVPRIVIKSVVEYFNAFSFLHMLMLAFSTSDPSTIQHPPSHLQGYQAEQLPLRRILTKEK
ncbi:hypothetical protein KQX54_021561 [Cotesia glomerata]|uniref:Uncharacterized protein n=1 Tax=Cotesia glomerata TaxID=32391 RepID=A0AAV7J739_COTGL|nr:hypothetical protein KQX54_021561 [Cotesia glomerata]